MRIYSTFPEAFDEIKRDLKEMGIQIWTKSVQNIYIGENPNYQSMELQNYTYSVTSPDIKSIPLKCPEWAEAEFKERVGGKALNPGEAWKLRKEYWEQFIGPGGRFDYAYSERLCRPVEEVIRALRLDKSTRRAFMGVFNQAADKVQMFDERIPCTIGYWLNFRQGKLNLTYLQRSSDFSEHFNYDVYLACCMMNYVANEIGEEPGVFTHWLGSLHIFAKDVADVY